MHFIDFETAKVLKEIEPEFPSLAYYDKKGSFLRHSYQYNNYPDNYNEPNSYLFETEKEGYSAPTQEQVRTWLRNKGFNIEVVSCGGGNFKTFIDHLQYIGLRSPIVKDSYEKGLESAIFVVLEYIKRNGFGIRLIE